MGDQRCNEVAGPYVDEAQRDAEEEREDDVGQRDRVKQAEDDGDEYDGARGAERNTGDGAGMLTALPYDFLRQVAKEEFGADLPEEGRAAVRE